MSDAVFGNKKPNPDKLLQFGFSSDNGKYTYTTGIMDGQFEMLVTVLGDGTVYTKVTEHSTCEEYVLHRISGAAGSYVGMVKADYGSVLREIAEMCFEQYVFKSDHAQKVIQYVRDKYKDDLEFLWKRYPNNAILRRKDSNKWYAALLVLSKKKLGLDSDEITDILNLRIGVEAPEFSVDGERYFPGYHMNKRHWYTICLDGTILLDEIFRRIDESYRLSTK